MSGGRSSHSVCLCLLGEVLCCHISLRGSRGGGGWMDSQVGVVGRVVVVV